MMTGMASRLRHAATIAIALALTAIGERPACAQDELRVYVGGLFGVSALSADGRSVVTPPTAAVSLYKPENGVALNAFVGLHLHPFVSVQANYVGNANDLTLLSSIAAPAGGGFSEQARASAQHAFVADALLFFRSLDSGVRPYLSTGLALLRFSSREPSRTVLQGLDAPERDISSTRIGVRVAVGIDLAMSRRWSFRYSFSETISGNPISERIVPPGERTLMNFQNLWGVVRSF
jgi:hypothetical protein